MSINIIEQLVCFLSFCYRGLSRFEEVGSLPGVCGGGGGAASRPNGTVSPGALHPEEGVRLQEQNPAQKDGLLRR